MLDDWQHARTDAQDVIHANQQDIMRQDFQTEMGAQLDTLPADQRPAYFQKQLPVLHEALATVPVSSRRAKLEAQRQTQWERQTYAAIYQQSTRQSIEQGAQIGVTNYYKKLTSGDVEGAHQGLTELRATHLLSDAQYQEHFIKGDALLLKQHSDRYLAENPRGMLTDIDESQKSGQPVPGFRWTPEQTRSYRRQAQAAVIQREVETGYATHQAIVQGEITDESTLRERAGQDLPPRRPAASPPSPAASPPSPAASPPSPASSTTTPTTSPPPSPSCAPPCAPFTPAATGISPPTPPCRSVSRAPSPAPCRPPSPTSSTRPGRRAGKTTPPPPPASSRPHISARSTPSPAKASSATTTPPPSVLNS